MGYSNFTPLNEFFLTSEFFHSNRSLSQPNQQPRRLPFSSHRTQNERLHLKAREKRKIRKSPWCFRGGFSRWFGLFQDGTGMDMNGLQTWKLSSTPGLLLIIPNFPRKKEEQIMNCPVFGLQNVPQDLWGEKIQPVGCFL